MNKTTLICLIIFCLLSTLVIACESKPAQSNESQLPLNIELNGPVVSISAPEEVSEAFDVSVDINNIAELDSGQFDLCFDSQVIEAIDVNNGSIGETVIPVDMWQSIDTNTIRVLFNLTGVDGVTGSGNLATIHFNTTGTGGDSSIIEISDGLLVDNEANEISEVNWLEDTVHLK